MGAATAIANERAVRLSRVIERSHRVAIGAVSRAVVDAAIEFGERTRRPVLLIASRGQVEAEELGPGYVENWTTEEYAEHVRRRDTERRVVLCRDHGGPFQGRDEGVDHATARRRAQLSLDTDISCGFEVLHLDMSRVGSGENALAEFVNLYAWSRERAGATGSTIVAEFGCEMQCERIASRIELMSLLDDMRIGLRSADLEMPAFVVAQTGMTVTGTANTGNVESLREVDAAVCLQQLGAACRLAGTRLKAHNCDYLSRASLSALRSTDCWRNIAPELGVTETRLILRLLRRLGLTVQAERLLAQAHDSGMWKKWLRGAKASDESRAIMSGHYVFADHVVRNIREELASELSRRCGLDLDRCIAETLIAVFSAYA